MAGVVRTFQTARNEVYGRFAAAGFTYLPIEAFKQALLTSVPEAPPERIFRSSGTAGMAPSRHAVHRLAVYDRAAAVHFAQVFGAGPFVLLAHLPGYAERGRESSLVHMASALMQRYGAEGSGFFLEDTTPLAHGIEAAERTGHPLLLLGAAFGLLDLVERGAPRLPGGSIVVETGGMKTRRREVGRAALHERLAEGFGAPRERVYSEYGMCELLSQCYTRGGEVFYAPPWMQVRIVDPAAPGEALPAGTEGAIAVIDLANLYSAAFILTEDRGAATPDGGFQVLGRLSGAELRGCNFLMPEAHRP